MPLHIIQIRLTSIIAARIGETIPIRLFLGGFDLTPTFRDVNKKYSTRYYLSLVLIDEGGFRVDAWIAFSFANLEHGFQPTVPIPAFGGNILSLAIENMLFTAHLNDAIGCCQSFGPVGSNMTPTSSGFIRTHAKDSSPSLPTQPVIFSISLLSLLQNILPGSNKYDLRLFSLSAAIPVHIIKGRKNVSLYKIANKEFF